MIGEGLEFGSVNRKNPAHGRVVRIWFGELRNRGYAINLCLIDLIYQRELMSNGFEAKGAVHYIFKVLIKFLFTALERDKLVHAASVILVRLGRSDEHGLFAPSNVTDREIPYLASESKEPAHVEMVWLANFNLGCSFVC